MFLFYHTKQTKENASFYKGSLFEKLLEDYLESLGYDVVLRQKHNSLEYDIEGQDRATHTRLVGEAKAFEKNIAGQVLSSFVGKLIPLGIMNKEVKGLFLSTSSLTAEAEDYYRQIESIGVRSIAGKTLFDSILKELKMASLPEIDRQISDRGYEIQARSLLSTDTGSFLAIVAGSPKSIAPSFLFLFNKKGQLVNDRNFLNLIINNVSEFSALTAITQSTTPDRLSERSIPNGLTVSKDWTDYRLPAGPSFYVGRKLLIGEAQNAINASKDSNILQLKSRSGVGKSSTLSMLHDRLVAGKIKCELHDARDIKSTLDVFSVVRRFTGRNSTPEDFRAIEDLLGDFVTELGESKAVFMVDQFEATFAQPEIFHAYENLASLFLLYPEKLYFFLARKNDQITTYDDSRISLEKINQISKHFELQDFSQAEAAELINNINRYSGKHVSNEILSYVLEFAQGFPWLLKRTMAHIIKLVTSTTIAQPELFATGLRLNDLFDEELEGLDEIEKEYLSRIASRLPADYHQLQRLFDEDPLLPKILDKLTQSRLLRLTGATYDTYNDVFKEYLVFKKLPEFRQAIIYRQYPNSVIAPFLHCIDDAEFSPTDLEYRLGIGKGSVFNMIKEWRNFNLIERNGEIWTIPKKVLEAYKQDNLGDYLRRQFVENDLVGRVMQRCVSSSGLKVDELPDFIQQSFPFVEATSQTWQLYATILKAWMRSLMVVEIDRLGVISLSKENRESIIKQLGNLADLKVRTRGSSDTFLPSASWKYVEDCFRDLKKGRVPETGEKSKALNDLRNGGWYTPNGLEVQTLPNLRREVTELLRTEPYSTIWIAAAQKAKLLPVMKNIVTGEFSEETLKWRLKKLLNWAKALKLIENRRHQYG